MKNTFLLLWIGFFWLTSNAQTETLNLWNKKIPNQVESSEKEVREITNILRISNVQNPTLEVYLAENNSKSRAVIICPGGGYGILAYDYEGTNFAKYLTKNGITTIVLKYRLPKSSTLINPQLAPLQDMQRAIRMVRFNAKKWGIDENKIGVLGFSAGGHLAASSGTHFNFEAYKKTDEIDSFSAKPNFMGLIYPVISMQSEITHLGSQYNLLGENPSKENITFFSNELQVSTETPPTFLVHSSNDQVVSVANSLSFYTALNASNIPTELHIYPIGGHGFAFAKDFENLNQWPELFSNWVLNLK